MMPNENGRVGMLIDLKRCTGCFSCQTACRETNGYSYDEYWLQVVRRDPVLVDGELRMYHILAPSLDKCAECVARESPPLCEKVCMGKALFVAPVEKLLPLMEKRHAMLITPE
jgi:Fe-S-cluster-containing dehydrogenase component